MEQELRHRKSVRGDVDEIVDSKNGKVNTKGIQMKCPSIYYLESINRIRFTSFHRLIYAMCLL